MQPFPEHAGNLLIMASDGPWLFLNPESVIVCERAETLEACLVALDDATDNGWYVAGLITYEAGWPLHGREPSRIATDLPLLWFGVYRDRTRAPEIAAPGRPCAVSAWQPDVSYDLYREQMRRIRDYIQAGDTYQVNYTFPCRAVFQGDPWTWFQQLYAAQPTAHAAYLDLGVRKILSLSPELFFQVDGDTLTTRPMKGTMPRAFYPEADQHMRKRLEQSTKDRAENVMIVDLLRNDMGRISTTGSVHVNHLFSIERYATLWQMTSTITSHSEAPLSETIKALFPCGSVTGAPKIRTMEIIDEVEVFPRGAYCGTIGWWGPRRKGRRAEFNVGIRTITLDTDSHMACYPVGSAVTWGSNSKDEYAECLAKAAVLTRPAQQFELLETLLFEDGAFFLLEEHLDRLCASADYFDIPASRDELRCTLRDAAAALDPGAWKIRLLLNRQGVPHATAEPVHETMVQRVALASAPVMSDNVFLYHKTTCRDFYEQARAGHPEADDVLLWNERGELTESSIANIVAHVDGRLVTPPVSCGLLAGVMRAYLLRSGIIHEDVILVDALADIEQLYLVNSVRKWMPVRLA